MPQPLTEGQMILQILEKAFDEETHSIRVSFNISEILDNEYDRRMMEALSNKPSLAKRLKAVFTG